MSDESVLQPGTVILNRFEILERVARGGFATVWKAQDRTLGKHVALKVLRGALADDPASVEELKRETLRSRELSHPHIVQTYDFVQDGPITAIAMEFIEGETLAFMASKQPSGCFNVTDLTQWLGDLCDALDYAHSERGGKKSIIHHDIKPGNFMVDRWGVAKVLDFGISKTITETRYQHTGQFAVAGTPPYMSPQQLRGQRPRPTDDIYSLGASIYALLTSKPPFYRGNMETQIREEIPPTMSARRAELSIEGAPIPDDWEETVSACLAKTPEARPPTIADVATRLGVREPSSRRTAPGPMPEPLDENKTKVLPVPGPRVPRWTFVAGGALVALAVAAVLLWPKLQPERTQPVMDQVVDRSAETTPQPVAPSPDSTAVPATAPVIEREPAPIDVAEPSVPPAADPERIASELRDAKRKVESEISASHWDRATAALAELRALDEASPDLTALTRRIADGREREGRLAELSTAIPAAIAAADWETASSLLDQLASAAPKHPDRARWQSLVDDQSAVHALLDAYRDAQESLDVEAYQRLWVDLGGQNLEKIRNSYRDLRSQTLTIEGVVAEVSGDSAKVRFQEKRTITPRVGSKQTSQGVIVLTLARGADGWRIASRVMER